MRSSPHGTQERCRRRSMSWRQQDKFSCFLADSIFSSDGVHPNPVGFLKAAIDVVHKNGGVFIADEVQPGFARTGDAFWGFARHGIIPDMVTTGQLL